MLFPGPLIPDYMKKLVGLGLTQTGSYTILARFYYIPNALGPYSVCDKLEGLGGSGEAN